MRTLKNLMVVIFIFGTTMFVNASEKKVVKEGNASYAKVVNNLQDLIHADFKEHDNYFNKNSINKFKSDVAIVFIVDSNNEFILLKATSETDIAVEYVKQLFNHTKINMPEECLNKKFKITLNLDYRTF